MKTDAGEEKNQIKEKTLHLHNARKQKLCVTLRQSHSGEEKALISCIRDEYGETYFKQNFYSPEYLREQAAGGHITFFVAEDNNKNIAGMLILKEFYPEEAMCEIASQIFKKEYRGYGLSLPFFEYVMEVLKSRSYFAAYCLPVLFHDITQRQLYKLGLRATGMILNVFDLKKISHSYENGRNEKHSQGIQVMALEKQDAGTMYVPMEHKAFTAQVYDRLQVRYRICTDMECPMPSAGELEYTCDRNQSSMEIRIHAVGEDCMKRIKLLLAAFPLKGRQTCNVFLNVNDPCAVEACQRLRRMGFFFTGYKCLCSKREYMVLHHPGEIPVYMEDYQLSGEFSILAKYIRNCYKEQYGERL